jgi:exodeoxyribonuclease V beta subunit
MDEAAVSTIHGWCNRMLREHAFDSDSHFTQTLETDQSELLAEVVRDYWRTFMIPLDAESVAEVRQWWSGPEALQGSIRSLVEHADRLDAAAEPAVALKAVRKEKADRLAALKAPWSTWADELQALLDDAVDSKRAKLQKRFYSSWLNALRDWAADPAAESLDLKTGWERLTPAGLAAVWTKGDPPPIPHCRRSQTSKPSWPICPPHAPPSCATRRAGSRTALPPSRPAAPRWASTTC